PSATGRSQPDESTRATVESSDRNSASRVRSISLPSEATPVIKSDCAASRPLRRTSGGSTRRRATRRLSGEAVAEKQKTGIETARPKSSPDRRIRQPPQSTSRGGPLHALRSLLTEI